MTGVLIAGVLIGQTGVKLSPDLKSAFFLLFLFVIGGLFGLLALHVGQLEIGISMSVGVLIGGLVLGWLRSVNRRFAQIPEGALWFSIRWG